VAAHDWGKSAAKAILADQHKKVSVLSLRNPFTSAMVQPFIDTIKAAGGEVLNHIEIDPQENPATLTQQIGEIFADNPDAVFIPAYNEQLSAIVKQTRGANNNKIYTFSMAASSGNTGNSRFIQNVGVQIAEGIHHLQPSILVERPEYQAFLQNMSGHADNLSPFAALASDQIAILALAMEKAGSSDATVFGKAIAAVANGPGSKTGDVLAALQLIRQGKDIDYTGIAMDISFDNEGSLLSRPFAHFQIRSGKDVEIDLIE
jgi:branched-chain amino acid transport system substrate-binding protein